MRAANLAVRFVLELCMLAALAYRGSQTGSGVVSVVVTSAAPLIAASVWGVFVAPKAPIQLPLSVRIVVELLLFAAATAALAAPGQRVLAAVFGRAVLVNEAGLLLTRE